MPASGIDPVWLAHPLTELGFPPGTDAGTVRVEAADGWRWGSVEAAFIGRLLEALRTGVREPALAGAPPELERLLMLAGASPRTPGGAPPRRAFLERVGLRARHNAGELLAFVRLMGEVVMLLPRLAIAKARVRAAEVLEVLAESSSRALAIVAVVNLLMGAILAFVGAVQLRRFGAGIYVADLVGIASVRELTPIITAIVLAGRTGASFAARIANMQGNEEIDALITLGVSPVEFLALPRAVALTVLMPLLYVYGCTFAILGGLCISSSILDISPTAYWTATQSAIGAPNFVIGGLKAAVFGALVALLGCHYGLGADRSATGVGFATTRAVVSSIVGIIGLDAVFAVCANALDV
jgi:phospholipid/cholesterol/gamma-HCH transport system permease protein